MAFRADLFIEPSQYEEWQLCDRKSELPNLYDDREKAEFVRDVIALANSARMLKNSARMLFGLDDQGGLCGVADCQLAPYSKRFQEQIKVWEEIRKKIGEIISNHITPIIGWDIKHGQIDGVQVAYLLIEPRAPRNLYQVHRAIVSGSKTLVQMGQCWIRAGESKQELRSQDITPDQEPYCYSYNEVPYVLPSVWETYLDALLADQDIQRGHQLMGYQGLLSTDGIVLDEVWQEFLAGNLRLLVISGAANSGKSVLLRRLVALLAEDAELVVKAIREREEFMAPSLPIPIHLPLRGRQIPNMHHLTNTLLNHLNCAGSFWKERPHHPERLFENPDLSWLICLDGLDEIWGQKQQVNFLEALRDFLDRYPRLKVILTTRPFEWQPDWISWRANHVTLAAFTDQQIEQYCGNFLDTAEYGEILAHLKKDKELWSLCSSPGYLAAALVELVGKPITNEPAEQTSLESKLIVELEISNTPIPNEEATELPVIIMDDLISIPKTEGGKTAEEQSVQSEADGQLVFPLRPAIILDRVYRALWEREIKRRPNLTAKFDQWWVGTGKLAAETDGHQPKFLCDVVKKRLGSIAGLYWLQSLGIIVRVNIDSVFGFATELTKAYFAAIYLDRLSQVGRIKLARQLSEKSHESFQAKVNAILIDISDSATSIANINQEASDGKNLG